MKRKKDLNKVFVELYQSWLEAYTAWLELDPTYKQMYPMPKIPIMIDGKVYL